MGGSSALALDAYHKFIRIGKRCEYQSDAHFQAMFASLFGKEDCIIAFSNTGSNKELVENLKIAKNNGVNIISITSNSKSPISKISDIVLISFGRENNFKSEAMESRVSALSLIDCLFVGVCLRDKETYLENLGKIRSAIAQKRY
jgi:DNA-binding MurR/RpiR family transcriptional regulator